MQARATGNSQVEEKKNISEVKIFKIVSGLRRRWDAVETKKLGELGDTFPKH